MADSLRLVLPLVLVFAAVAFAQIPNIGRCPQYGMIPLPSECIRLEIHWNILSSGRRRIRLWPAVVFGQMVRDRQILHRIRSIV